MQQILEKTRKNGQSLDPSVGFKWQFQYSRNIDISNIKNGLTLSSAWDEFTSWSLYTYCSYDSSKLVRFQQTAVTWTYPIIYSSNSEWPTTTHAINTTPSQIKKAIWFKDLVYGFWLWYACTVVPNVWWAVVNITAGITWTDPDTWTVYTYSKCDILMNYSNSMILMADGNKLRRYVPVASPSLPIWRKVVRVFEEQTTIKGLTMEWNYLKIWVQDKYLQTKVHYATGTFDMEYSGLVQTVKLDQQLVVSVESDTVYDYVLCRNSVEDTTFYLYRMQGTNKTLIKRTILQQWTYYSDFTYPDCGNMQIKKSTLYNPMWDWIWTFRNESVSQWLSSGIVSAPVLSWWSPSALYAPVACQLFGNYLYVSYQVWVWAGTVYKEIRVNTEFRPPTYIESWYVIGLIKDGGLMWFDKENSELRLSYLLPVPSISLWHPTTDPGKINIYLRYDRESLWIAGGRNLVKTIDNRTHMREIVLPTTDVDFNRNWNVLEYMIEIVRSTTTPAVAPTFFEYNHLYEFTNRIDVNQAYFPYVTP